jgi:hypothetical protein
MVRRDHVVVLQYLHQCVNNVSGVAIPDIEYLQPDRSVGGGRSLLADFVEGCQDRIEVAGIADELMIAV